MKVLMLNGSPHKEGNTARALKEMQDIFEKEGMEVETVRVGHLSVPGCHGCGGCTALKKCAIDDVVNEIAEKLRECDGMVIASPVYFAAANGTLISVLNRLFYSSRFDKRMKVGASVAVARRGGCSTTFDQINKYFTYSGMPLASGQYWNSLHGARPGEAEGDEEGLQNLRAVANNMVFLMKSIALGKEAYGIPEREKLIRTNYIREDLMEGK